MAMISDEVQLMMMAAMDPVFAKAVREMWNAELARKQQALKLLQEVQQDIQFFINTTSLEKLSIKKQFAAITKDFISDKISCQIYIEKGRTLLAMLRAYEQNKYHEDEPARLTSKIHRLGDVAKKTGTSVYDITQSSALLMMHDMLLARRRAITASASSYNALMPAFSMPQFSALPSTDSEDLEFERRLAALPSAPRNAPI